MASGPVIQFKQSKPVQPELDNPADNPDKAAIIIGHVLMLFAGFISGYITAWLVRVL